MAASYSLTAQIQGLQQGLASLDAARRADAYGPALRAAITTLGWWREHEAPFRQWLEAQRLAPARAPAPSREIGLDEMVHAVSSTIDRMHTLVGRSAANDSQRAYLRGRLEAALNTLVFIALHEAYIRAWRADQRRSAA